jgi:hypothetical protein
MLHVTNTSHCETKSSNIEFSQLYVRKSFTIHSECGLGGCSMKDRFTQYQFGFLFRSQNVTWVGSMKNRFTQYLLGFLSRSFFRAECLQDDREIGFF